MISKKPSINTLSRSSASFRSFSHLFTPDRLAVGISFLAILVSYLVTDRVFERMPHIEDEVAYVWQARAIAAGQMTIPTPPHANSYLVPFVVELDGQRFGKYPPGWPALLAVAVKLGLRAWLNPLLAGLGVWLTYRLGKRFFSHVVGLLAAGLTVSSPFFLMNSGSLLSHPFGMVLTAAFALAWLNLFSPDAKYCVSTTNTHPQSAIHNHQSTIYILLAGGSLGMLVLTRPFTALAVAIPFGLHGLYLLVRGILAGLPTERAVPPTERAVARRVLAVGLIALAFVGLYLGWQKVVTGDALKNPYVLWWPYDKIGFGKGYGILERGHNWKQALYNTRGSLVSGAYDLFGWGALSWIFIPYGLWAVTAGEKLALGEKTPKGEKSHAGRRAVGGPVAQGGAVQSEPVAQGEAVQSEPVIQSSERDGPIQGVPVTRPYADGLRNRQAWMLLGMATSLVIVYMAYWIGSELYGPRYYYEGLFSLTLLSGAGIAFLAGWRVNPSAGEEAGGRIPPSPIHRVWPFPYMAVFTRLHPPYLGVSSPQDAKRPNSRENIGGNHMGLGGNHMGLPLRRFRAPAVMLLVVGLVGYNLAVYLPGRLQEMHGLYGIKRGIIRDFLNARIYPQEGEQTEGEGLGEAAGSGNQSGLGNPAGLGDHASGERAVFARLNRPSPLLPALIIVHSETWHFYGALLELEDPFMTTPYVFAWSLQPTIDATLHNDFPARTVYHYYQDDPGVLYRRPRDKE